MTGTIRETTAPALWAALAPTSATISIASTVPLIDFAHRSQAVLATPGLVPLGGCGIGTG